MQIQKRYQCIARAIIPIWTYSYNASTRVCILMKYQIHVYVCLYTRIHGFNIYHLFSFIISWDGHNSCTRQRERD